MENLDLKKDGSEDGKISALDQTIELSSISEKAAQTLNKTVELTCVTDIVDSEAEVIKLDGTIWDSSSLSVKTDSQTLTETSDAEKRSALDQTIELSSISEKGAQTLNETAELTCVTDIVDSEAEVIKLDDTICDSSSLSVKTDSQTLTETSDAEKRSALDQTIELSSISEKGVQTLNETAELTCVTDIVDSEAEMIKLDGSIWDSSSLSVKTDSQTLTETSDAEKRSALDQTIELSSISEKAAQTLNETVELTCDAVIVDSKAVFVILDDTICDNETPVRDQTVGLNDTFSKSCIEESGLNVAFVNSNQGISPITCGSLGPSTLNETVELSFDKQTDDFKTSMQEQTCGLSDTFSKTSVLQESVVSKNTTFDLNPEITGTDKCVAEFPEIKVDLTGGSADDKDITALNQTTELSSTSEKSNIVPNVNLSDENGDGDSSAPTVEISYVTPIVDSKSETSRILPSVEQDVSSSPDSVMSGTPLSPRYQTAVLKDIYFASPVPPVGEKHVDTPMFPGGREVGEETIEYSLPECILKLQERIEMDLNRIQETRELELEISKAAESLKGIKDIIIEQKGAERTKMFKEQARDIQDNPELRKVTLIKTEEQDIECKDRNITESGLEDELLLVADSTDSKFDVRITAIKGEEHTSKGQNFNELESKDVVVSQTVHDEQTHVKIVEEDYKENKNVGAKLTGKLPRTSLGGIQSFESIKEKHAIAPESQQQRIPLQKIEYQNTLKQGPDVPFNQYKTTEDIENVKNEDKTSVRSAKTHYDLSYFSDSPAKGVSRARDSILELFDPLTSSKKIAEKSAASEQQQRYRRFSDQPTALCETSHLLDITELSESTIMETESMTKVMTLEQDLNHLKLQINQMQKELLLKDEVILNMKAESQKHELELIGQMKQVQEELDHRENNPEIQNLKQKILTLQAKEKETLEQNQRLAESEALLKKKLMDSEPEIVKLREDNARTSGHLSTLEMAFSDIHAKYERAKDTIHQFKNNEDVLRAKIAEIQGIALKFEERYQSLKSHAKSQIEKANRDLFELKEHQVAEVNKITNLNRRLEIKVDAIQKKLDQKTSECTALTQLCDEITGTGKV